MKPYQYRVVVEKNELDAKIAKLDKFIEGDAYKELTETEQDLLTTQGTAMQEYSAALDARIDYWGINPEEGVESEG